MKVQQMYNKRKAPISKDKQILNRICKECDRYRKIPQHFCNECWKEMDKTINKGENNE